MSTTLDQADPHWVFWRKISNMWPSSQILHLALKNNVPLQKEKRLHSLFRYISLKKRLISCAQPRELSKYRTLRVLYHIDIIWSINSLLYMTEMSSSWRDTLVLKPLAHIHCNAQCILKYFVRNYLSSFLNIHFSYL